MAFLKMTKKVLTSLFSKPATHPYPAAPKQVFPATRGKILIDIKQCIFCGICAKRCPADAIKVSKETKTWEIDLLRCIYCKNCVDLCPKKCLSQANKYNPPALGPTKESFTQ